MKKLAFRASGFAIVLTLLLPGIAHANNVAVNCPADSLGATVSALPPNGPNIVTVTGTCINENVGIFNMRSLTVVAGAGGAKIVQAQDNDTFDIFRSFVKLVNLEISGVPGSMPGSGGAGVFIGQTSNVRINGCDIHDNEGGGVTATQGSLLFLNNTTIHNNNPGGDGLDVLDNSTANVIGSTIQDNGSACTVLLNCQANGDGVFVSASIVFFRQNNLIQNNGDNGIGAIRGSTVVLGNPTVLLGNNTIQGHNWNAIYIKSGSHFEIHGSAVIQENGNKCPADTALLVSLSQACGGISAAENSTVNLRGGTISDNKGAGVSVRQGATLGLIGTTISNNSGDGVHIQWISSGNFGPGNSITDNTGAAIFCDESSLAIGNLSAFTSVKCGNR